MIEHVKNLIKGKDHYYVVGYNMLKDKVTYDFIEIAIEDDELKIIQNQTFTAFEGELELALKKDYPILLNLEGDNVISRVTENKQGYRNNVVFKMNPEDFYFYEYHQGSQVYISLTRKKVVDEFIALLSNKEKYVVHMSIGPFVLTQLFSMIKDENTLSSNYHTLKFEANTIISFEKTVYKSKSFIISNDSIQQSETALLATFFEYKTNSGHLNFDDAFLTQNRNEQKFRKWFKRAVTSALVFFILLLFIGHQLLSYYVETLAEKESIYAISQQAILQVNELKEERELKEKILQSSGVIDTNLITQYFAEIGNIVPESITINAISVAPISKKIKPHEKVSFETKTIKIEGESLNDNDFNTMIKLLRTISWIKQVEISSFIEDKTGNEFILNIRK